MDVGSEKGLFNADEFLVKTLNKIFHKCEGLQKKAKKFMFLP